MQKVFLFIILFSALNAFSQNLKSCKSVDDVESLIEGDWKLKNDTKNVVYRFSISNHKGFIEVLPEMNLPPKAEKTTENEIIINDHENFTIVLKQGNYYIEIQSLYYQMTEKITVLNQTNFVYGKGKSQRTFIRD
ncbi:hypothetical protein [Algibacter luteus]|uniref:hypothetical protein n=1 Tax=Algibacter luteus TaxID=1178825 RepID=UPI002597ECC2|nr:hypothetical protein [Algibacter luteus]WJJ96077.1 hypothetical protein O5O44_12705 [Algibacter luteus]